MNKKDVLYLTILSTLTLVLALWWFPKTTPDSFYYIELVYVFRGNLPLLAAMPPFCYRPLMPFIVSLFPTDVVLTFCSINVLLSVVLAWLTYFLVKTFDVNEFGAFVATGLSSVSIMTVALASVALTDMPAIVCIVLAFIGIRRKWNPASIVAILAIGVAFKEIVIVAAVAWVIIEYQKAYGRRWVHIWQGCRWHRLAWALAGLSFVTGVYFWIRWMWTLVGVQANETSLWRWNHLWNFVNRPEGVIKTFWLGFMFWIPAVVVILVLHLASYDFKESYKWLWQTGLPFLALMFVGLFTAYFSLRFIWPLYFSMAPIVAQAASIIWDKIAGPLQDVVAGLFTIAALFFGILVVLPLSILAHVSDIKVERQWQYNKDQTYKETDQQDE